MFSFFYVAFLMRRHHFIGNFGEEVQFGEEALFYRHLIGYFSEEAPFY